MPKILEGQPENLARTGTGGVQETGAEKQKPRMNAGLLTSSTDRKQDLI
jgi:hypothetical protein